MILQGPRRVKEGFWGLPRYRRDFVHAMIDNPLKRIILKIGNNRNIADKEKQGTERLTFVLDNSLIKGKIANLVFSTQAALQDEITWKKIT
jgi:hypothetical protein